MPRRLFRTLARTILQADWPGEPLASWSGPSGWLHVQRQAALEIRFARRAARLFPDLAVRSGPFSGLRYPTSAAHGSALWPKLLGTYESELHPVFEDLLGQPFDNIVDIGFAEGYYLVGLALRLPSAQVWGFDPSPAAHRLCADLAAANKLAPARLRLSGPADEALLAPALAGRALVVCDCEGCEAGLFSQARAHLWRDADLVIECHDFVSPKVTADICAALSPTHRIRLVSAIPTAAKLSLLDAPAFSHLATAEKLRLLSECRPAAQDWIVAQAIR